MKSIVLICLCVSSIWAVPFVGRKPVPVHKDFNGRIVGGITAQDGQFPWMVAVYFDNPDGSFFGGGALIDPKWVLTSGYNVYRASVFTLHLGSNSLVDDDPNRVTIGASYYVIHPDYNPDTLDNDIGLIRIDTTIELNEFIRVIPLPSSALGAGESVVVSGWGATGDWDGASNDLYYVALNSISNTDCQSVYGDEVITESMVCAVGKTTEGTCNGDVGGPLVTSGDSPTVVGIVSWASAAGCETDHPSGYTRVFTYVDWINDVIG